MSVYRSLVSLQLTGEGKRRVEYARQEKISTLRQGSVTTWSICVIMGWSKMLV
jgi:hypothetical protein